MDKIKYILIPPNSLLIILYVESMYIMYMYTNVLHENGLESITERYKSSTLDENVFELLELCLNSNDLEFDGKWFLQYSGTTMGTEWLNLIMQNIYMTYFEEKVSQKYPHNPFIYLRYLDDIFIIWHHGRTAFSEFIDIFNSHQHPIRFKTITHGKLHRPFEHYYLQRPKISKFFTNQGLTDIHQLLEKHRFTLNIRLVVY